MVAGLSHGGSNHRGLVGRMGGIWPLSQCGCSSAFLSNLLLFFVVDCSAMCCCVRVVQLGCCGLWLVVAPLLDSPEVDWSLCLYCCSWFSCRLGVMCVAGLRRVGGWLSCVESCLLVVDVQAPGCWVMTVWCTGSERDGLRWG